MENNERVNNILSTAKALLEAIDADKPVENNKSTDNTADTMNHKEKVKTHIEKLIKDLQERAEKHDNSKLQNPEKDGYASIAVRLKPHKYGSDGAKEVLASDDAKAIVKHHQQENRHHPEHFENGIKGMTLVDIVEMFCDWYASSQRSDVSDFNKGLEINQKRFGYGEDLNSIFINTFNEYFK